MHLPALPDALESRVIEILGGDPAAADAAIAALCDAHADHAAAVRDLVAAARAVSAPGGASLAAAFADLVARMPTRIGQYRLLERLGSGGMGVVYLAEQPEPLRRKVALKVLTGSARSAEIAARFTVERQALAMLEHPHIAKVFEAGCTEDGTAYLALEYVAARATITNYCNEHRCDVRERLRLLLCVCDAVQHAHSRGILHRDLKPANVLVDCSGREAAPKVIDFGIAKIFTAAAPSTPFATRAGAMLGTSVYMSPEQAQGSPDIDTRADVYSLGAIAHELLVGEYPGEEHDLLGLYQRDFPKFLTQLHTLPPSVPSERVAALGDGTARRCGTTAHRLARGLRGDLDAIVVRALAKPRAQRYQSAADFARDLERYLAGEPISARVAGRGARLRRFVARNLWVVAAAALVVAAGAVAVVAVLRANRDLAEQNRQLAQERTTTAAALEQAQASEQRAVAAQRVAEQQRQGAETARVAAEAARAQALAAEAEAAISLRRLGDQVAVADEVHQAMADLLAGGQSHASSLTVTAWLDRVTQLLDSRLPLWNPAVESGLRKTVGWLRWGLGDDRAARRQFEVLAERPATSRDERLERAAILHALGDATLDVRRPEQRLLAIGRLREALRILQAEPRRETDPWTLRVQGDLAFLLMQTGQAADATEGQRLIVDSLCKALGFKNQVTAMLGVLGVLQEMRTAVKANGAAAGDRVLDEFLAPILAAGLLRQRLCDILCAASTYPQLRPHRELVLRAALRYGERFNGRGHRHTALARVALLRAILDTEGAAGAADRREEFVRLAAEQAAIDATMARAPQMDAAIAAFASAVEQVLGPAAGEELMRLAAVLAREVSADNPVVVRLTARGHR